MEMLGSRKAQRGVLFDIHGRISCFVQVAVGRRVAIGFDLAHRNPHGESLI